MLDEAGQGTIMAGNREERAAIVSAHPETDTDPGWRHRRDHYRARMNREVLVVGICSSRPPAYTITAGARACGKGEAWYGVRAPRCGIHIVWAAISGLTGSARASTEVLWAIPASSVRLIETVGKEELARIARSAMLAPKRAWTGAAVRVSYGYGHIDEHCTRKPSAGTTHGREETSGRTAKSRVEWGGRIAAGERCCACVTLLQVVQGEVDTGTSTECSEDGEFFSEEEEDVRQARGWREERPDAQRELEEQVAMRGRGVESQKKTAKEKLKGNKSPEGVCRLAPQGETEEVEEKWRYACCLSVRVGELPKLRVMVKGVAIETLMDTGSAKSFIAPRVVEQCGLPTKALQEAQKFVCANGQELRTKEEVEEVPLKMGEWEGSHSLLVADSSQPMLLGIDFFERNVENWSFRYKKITLRADRKKQHAEEEFAPVKVEPPRAAIPGRDQLRRLTWERTVKKGWKAEELRKKREKDRRPFRKASAAEEEADSADEERASREPNEREETRKTVDKPVKRSRIGEDTPFQIAGPDEWDEKPRATTTTKKGPGSQKGQDEARSENATLGPTMEVCSIVRARKWLRNGTAAMVGFIKIERVQNELQFVGTLQSGEGGTATAMLSGMPEQYPILELPSQWLRKEGKEVAEDVAKMLDEYAELFQELPRGGSEGKSHPASHRNTTRGGTGV